MKALSAGWPCRISVVPGSKRTHSHTQSTPSISDGASPSNSEMPLMVSAAVIARVLSAQPADNQFATMPASLITFAHLSNSDFM
jgi:hypothetical protein